MLLERNGSGNLFNRHVISWGLFISRLGTVVTLFITRNGTWIDMLFMF